MSEQVDIYKIIVEVEGAKTVGELEQGLKNLKKEAKNLDIGTVAFADMQHAIQETEQKLGVLGSTVRQSGDKITNVYKKAANGIVGGFQAAAGVMGVFTNGSEEAVKALLKIQALMSLKEGFTGLIEAKKSFGDLTTIIGQNLTRAFSTAAGAARAFGAALGIGLIITALTLVVKKWDDIKEAVTGVNREFQKNVDIANELVKQQQARIDDLEDQGEILKQQGKTEKQILQYKIEQRKALLEYKRDAIQMMIDLIDAQVKANKKFNTSGRGGQYGTISKMLFGTSQDTINEENKILDDLNKDLAKIANSIAGFENRITEIDIKVEEDRAAIAKKNAEKRRQAKEDAAKKAAELEGQQQKDAAERQAFIENQIIEEEKDRQEALQAELEEIKEFYDQKQLALMDSYIQGQITKEQFDLMLAESEMLRLQAEIDTKASYGEQTTELLLKQKQTEFEIAERANQKILENDKATMEARIMIAQSGADILQNIGDILASENDKQNMLAKAAALIRIGIDTAQAISALVRNSEMNPANAVTGGLAGIAQFALGIARITKNIAEAKKLLGAGSSNSVGNVSNSSSGQAPVINPVPVQTTQIRQRGANGDVRVKVLVKDINDGQRVVQVIDGNALVVE